MDASQQPARNIKTCVLSGIPSRVTPWFQHCWPGEPPLLGSLMSQLVLCDRCGPTPDIQVAELRFLGYLLAQPWSRYVCRQAYLLFTVGTYSARLDHWRDSPAHARVYIHTPGFHASEVTASRREWPSCPVSKSKASLPRAGRWLRWEGLPCDL